MASKKVTAAKPAAKSPESHLLAKYEHHKDMAEKHRAHADLIEAKLRVGGKRITHDYEATSPSGSVKRKIVSVKP
jgi:hypothetical protein